MSDTLYTDTDTVLNQPSCVLKKAYLFISLMMYDIISGYSYVLLLNDNLSINMNQMERQ